MCYLYTNYVKIAEIVQARKKVTDQKAIGNRFCGELHEVVQHIQEPRLLKDAIAKFHKKYVPNGVTSQVRKTIYFKEFSKL